MGNKSNVLEAMRRLLSGKELHYKRIPFEKVKNVTYKPTEFDLRYAPSRKKKGTIIGIGVGP